MSKHAKRWTDDEFRKYVNDDDAGDMHFHFAATGLEDWIDVAAEGLRVYNLITNDGVEEFSAIDDVIRAVAAQSSHGMANAIARALGIDAEVLERGIAYWIEGYESSPARTDVVTLDELIEVGMKSIASIKAGK